MWKFDYEFGLTPLLGCSWLAVKLGCLRVDPANGFVVEDEIVTIGNEKGNENDNAGEENGDGW